MDTMMVDILSLVGLGMIFSISVMLMLVALVVGSWVWNVVFFVCSITSAIAFVYQLHKVEGDN